jgi:hypothetical protein
MYTKFPITDDFVLTPKLFARLTFMGSGCEGEEMAVGMGETSGEGNLRSEANFITIHNKS